MATRLEELHGHQYTMQRVANALTRHEPDPGGPRTPRPLTLALVSAMIAALLLVVVLVINLITGRGGVDQLRQETAVLIEKETGAQYVYVKNDGRLHPVLNYASGLLLAEGNGAAPSMLKRSRLAELRQKENVEIGARLGIPGAPNAVPRAADLIRESWSVCARGDGAVGTEPHTDLLFGNSAVGGGKALKPAVAKDAGQALLVQVKGQNTMFLVFGNRKLKLTKPNDALGVFGDPGRVPQFVSAAWLNALPQGPDVSAPTVEGKGARSQAFDGTVGQLVKTTNGATNTWALVRRDDVLRISEVQAQLLLRADPDALSNVANLNASAFEALNFSKSPPSATDAQLPANAPNFVSFTSGVCVQVADASGAAVVVVDPTPAASSTPAAGTDNGASTVTESAGVKAAAVDRITVPFGRGILVRAVSSTTAPAGTGTLSIITDSGVRYAIGDQTALAKLGYSAATPQNMPGELVSLVPEGPALRIDAAQKAG